MKRVHASFTRALICALTIAGSVVLPEAGRAQGVFRTEVYPVQTAPNSTVPTVTVPNVTR